MDSFWRRDKNPLDQTPGRDPMVGRNARAQDVNDRQAVERRRTSGLVQSIDGEFLIDPENKLLSVTDVTGQERLLLGLLDSSGPDYGLKLTDPAGNVMVDLNDSYSALYGDFLDFFNTGRTAYVEIQTGDTVLFGDTGAQRAAVRMNGNVLEVNTGNYGGTDILLYAAQGITLTPNASYYITLNGRNRTSYLGVLEDVAEPTLAGGYAEIYVDTADNTLKIKKASGVVSLEGGGGTSDHGALTGLADDDHTQYVHISTARTITAVHTFNPGSAGAPFALGANATGQLVSGLNADKLDSQEGSYYLNLAYHTFSGSSGGLFYSPDGSSIACSSSPGASGRIPISTGATTWSWQTPSFGDHGSLTGLSDDDHSQYMHISSARTVTAIHTFSTGIKVGTISEASLNAGVTVDSLLIKDGGLVATSVPITGNLAVSGTISEGGSALSALYSAVGHTHNSLTGSTNLDFTISSTLRMRLQTTTYDLQVDGDVVAYSTVTGSDRKLKTEIKPILGALRKVRALSGYTFLKRGRPGAGVIAQEVAEVLPEAVQEYASLSEPKESFLTVQIDGVVGLLVEAVKEMAARIEALEMTVARISGRPV